MRSRCRLDFSALPLPNAVEGLEEVVSTREAPHEERALTRRCAATSPASGRGEGRSLQIPWLRKTAAGAIAMLVCFAQVATAAADELAPYTITGDGIANSLTGLPGDPARGRALVLARTTTCILCHSGPFPETRFQGDLAPDLRGAGNRWTTDQLRLRLVDASRFNPETIMPSYYRIDGLVRVGRNVDGKPILSAAEIEDIVAYLATLRD